jgi:hypothetical protein
MLSKLLGCGGVAVIGLLLAGPQKASADVVFACVNTTTGLLYVVSATTNCPPASSGATWIKINWTANAGSQASNVLFTPVLQLVSDGTVSCLVVNVAAQQRMVTGGIFNSNGSVGNGIDVGLPAGQLISVSVTHSADRFYCKFTATDGTSSDIRGALQVCVGSACTSVAAQ